MTQTLAPEEWNLKCWYCCSHLTIMCISLVNEKHGITLKPAFVKIGQFFWSWKGGTKHTDRMDTAGTSSFPFKNQGTVKSEAKVKPRVFLSLAQAKNNQLRPSGWRDGPKSCSGNDGEEKSHSLHWATQMYTKTRILLHISNEYASASAHSIDGVHLIPRLHLAVYRPVVNSVSSIIFKIIPVSVQFLLKRTPHTTGFSFKWKIELCNTVYGNVICIAPGYPCMGNNERVNLANNPVWLQSSHTSCGNFIHATKYHEH